MATRSFELTTTVPVAPEAAVDFLVDLSRHHGLHPYVVSAEVVGSGTDADGSWKDWRVVERPRLGPFRYTIRFPARMTRTSPTSMRGDVTAARGCTLVTTTHALGWGSTATLYETTVVTAPLPLIGYMTKQARIAHARTYGSLPKELGSSGSAYDPRLRPFLDHLEDPDRGTWDDGIGAAEAGVATGLLDAGFGVKEFYGPVQMDVWGLWLIRGTVTVQLGIERGFSDGIHLGGAGIDPPERTMYVGPEFGFVRFIWLARTGAELPSGAARQLVEARVISPTPAELADWRPLVEWLGRATADDLAAINRTDKARWAWIHAQYFMPTRIPSAAQLDEGARLLLESARA